MKAPILSFIMFIFLIAPSVQGGILFKELTITQAVELANKEGKLVFVDFYADACPPCKYMEEHVFNAKELGDLINNNFIAIRSHSGNIEGKKEQAKYRIDMLPTMLIIDPENGELVRFRGKKELSYLLSAVQNAVNGNYEQGDLPAPKNDEIPKRPTFGIREE